MVNIWHGKVQRRNVKVAATKIAGNYYATSSVCTNSNQQAIVVNKKRTEKKRVKIMWNATCLSQRPTPQLQLITTSTNKPSQMLLISDLTLTLWRPLLSYGYSYKASSDSPGYFVIFDIRALWRSRVSVRECPNVKNYKWRLNPVWHRMLYSCTHMATVGVKGLSSQKVWWNSFTVR